MQDKTSFYINGAWVAPLDGTVFDVINPSTEEPFAVISLGGQADTNRAVVAARAAFEPWMMTPKIERLALMEKLAVIYEEMGEAMSLEIGAPIDMAGAGNEHIEEAINTLRSFEFDRMLGDHAPNDQILMEPIGVVGQITPWNWPMNQVVVKVLPAMAAGCTIVLKPSEIAPLSSYLFAEMVHEADFPNGVFNMVHGDGAGVGSQLTAHSDVDMISFTGSSRAVALITKNAADTVKRIALELGEKGANIIFADADSDAVERGVYQCMGNTGLSCNAPTRMLTRIFHV